MKIIDMIQNSQKGTQFLNLHQQFGKFSWCVAVLSVVILIMLSPIVSIKNINITLWMKIGGTIITALGNCILVCWFFMDRRKKRTGSLTLQTDCLYRQDGHPMIQIRQMKTTTFVKPISAELELLIEKAIEYSKKRYGDTVYIFVDEKNSKRPMQYNTVQNKVMDLIQKKDLRDDHGELFGFGTHMFRHVYGIRLTELHLDDWTIAKLLGHTSVKNVKFYRKMSLQIIADETREIRAEMSRMIRANLAGWGKEYEQI